MSFDSYKNADSLSPILRSEAEFADAQYKDHEGDLDINHKFYSMYADPHNLWEWREKAALLLGNVRGKKVLDLGCGMGEEAVYLARLGARVTAIDISPKGIDITRQRAKHNGLVNRIDARVADIFNNRLVSGSFDCIHGLGILHHIGAATGLRETYRLLKKNGTAVFLEPMENSRILYALKPRILWLMNRPYNYTRHERPLTIRELKIHRQYFSTFNWYPYHLVFRFRRLVHVGKQSSRYIKKLDYRLLKIMPLLGHFAGGVVIHAVK